MTKLSRKALIINGAERYVLYNPEKDTLALTLRRLGLTGTKIGCGSGVCGACTVIVDGKVTRSCIVKTAILHSSSSRISTRPVWTAPLPSTPLSLRRAAG